MGAKICDAWAQDHTVCVFVGGDAQLMLGSDEIQEFSDMCIYNQYSGTSEVRTIWDQAIQFTSQRLFAFGSCLYSILIACIALVMLLQKKY